MDLLPIKEHNQGALLRVLEMLFAMVGIVRGGSVAVVQRQLRLRVLRLLRTAESSVRRLMVVAAQDEVVDLGPPRPVAEQGRRKDRQTVGARGLAFPLIEALPRTQPPAPRYATAPRISFFDGTDPVIETPPAPPSPTDDVDAERLCQRLNRLQKVLDDLPKHARRLARWQARRKAAARRPGRLTPLRPGRPPGYRARGVHPVDAILIECETIARFALSPDTS